MRQLSPYEVSQAQPGTPRAVAIGNRRADRLSTAHLRGQLPKNADVGALAHDMAAHLLMAQGVRERELLIDTSQRHLMTTPDPALSLIGPNQFTDDELRDYLLVLAPHAVSNSPYRMDAPSPNLIGALLGGISMQEVERQIFRALTLLDAYPTEEEPVLAEALHAVGFGSYINHNAAPVEITDKRVGTTINWLRTLPKTRPYVETVLSHGAVPAVLTNRLERIRKKVIDRVNALLTPGDRTSISEFMHSQLQPRKADNADFNVGVRKLFEGSWHELMLNGKVDHDIGVIAARCLLIEMCAPGNRRVAEVPTMSGQHLVGFAMLTGISVAKWVQFALMDANRRGECFLTAKAVHDAIEIIESTELDAWFTCKGELEQMAASIGHRDKARLKIAARLRKEKWPLWSNVGFSYYAHEDGTYRNDPERE